MIQTVSETVSQPIDVPMNRTDEPSDAQPGPSGITERKKKATTSSLVVKSSGRHLVWSISMSVELTSMRPLYQPCHCAYINVFIYLHLTRIERDHDELTDLLFYCFFFVICLNLGINVESFWVAANDDESANGPSRTAAFLTHCRWRHHAVMP